MGEWDENDAGDEEVMLIEWSWSHSYYLLIGITLSQNVYASTLSSLPSINYVQAIYIKSLPTTSQRAGIIIIGPLNR